ncbi:hypothetical protein [uncultured Pelagimonas sp.]|uniref:hypothetical protein n=1 Tax=uncultured Pelagimonas sp. TaxID=1618102 RepID=UPI002630A6FD|nr:hypothetical protein [uncultured Pelagimonas sp.]
MTVLAVQNQSLTPGSSWLGMPASTWIGILSSLSASGIFFAVAEFLRFIFDKTASRNFEKLQFYERTLGIKECFSQKGSDEANRDYGQAIASAKYRVWAFGISNGEFLTQHLDDLISKKKKKPALDVCICFVDPDARISIEANPPLSLVSLFDITRDPTLTTGAHTRVAERIAFARTSILQADVEISLKLISAAGYVSAMVVDDIIYVFPYTAISKDNTRTPYLKIVVDSQLGDAFYTYFESIIEHPKLSRVVPLE